LLTVWVRLGPLPEGLLEESEAVRSTTVLDRNGEVLYEARSDLGTRETRLRADALPPTLVAATLAAEDHRFYGHFGLDPIAMARAAWRNLAALDRVEGGSTLTQQVAKLLLDRRALSGTGSGTGSGRASGEPSGIAVLARRRGWIAKVEEAVLALRLEHRLSKADILALYLNLAPYGNQIAGAERASRAYFGAPASMLTPAQAAFLAALPQRPSRFNPWRSLDQAMARQRIVLARMERRGLLDASAAAQARDERLRLIGEDARFLAPHFVGMVLADLPDPKPARVVATLDAGLQRAVEGIVRSQRALLERHGAKNVAVVVLDNTTSQWLAWEGSGNFGSRDRGGSINGAIAPRQPGSALKPFTYALAFEAGETPATLLPDIPSTFPTAEDGVVYTPRNYDGRFRGPLLARAALAGSINVPAVALASDLGVPNVLRFLRRAGFTTFEKTGAHYGLGVTLGNAEVRLDELTAAFAAFARGGEWLAPRATLDPQPRVADPVRLVSPRTAYWITDVLADDEARAFVFGRGGHLEFPFPVAVKTGTSQAYHDNWTVGSSRHVTVGVWVGNFDRSPLVGSSGVTGAGPLFHAVMLAAEAQVAGSLHESADTVVDVPVGLVETTVCALSGMRAGDSCPVRRRERLSADSAPTRRGALACTWHRHVDGAVATVWPDRYRAWAEAHGLLTVSDRVAATVGQPRGGRSADRSQADDELRVAHPAEGTVFLIDPTLRAEFQALPFRATGVEGAEVSWSVNGRNVGSASADRAVLWPLERGSHVASVRDGRGRTAAVSFVVK
jgi:penicillin-binding protein 1C